MTETRSELERQVLDGGRFVIFQYCLSVLVMSFKRPSTITYIPPGGDGAGPAITHSLISLVAGWWGIPWGPIWTISTVIKNARGGTDVTQAVLVEKVGPGRAAQIIAQRRVVPPNGWGLKAFRWGLGTVALLLVLFAIVPFIMALTSPRTGYNQASWSDNNSSSALVPGASEFASANSQIGVNRSGVAFGNSSKAIAVAGHFSTSMKTARQMFFEGGKPDGLSASKHEFLTHCELRDSTCAIIVHVPELRRFKLDAKETLGQLAWEAAQAALRKEGITQKNMKLAVGLRGITLYDRVLIGNVATNQNDDGLRATITDARPERELYDFFQPQPRALPSPGN